MIIRLSVNGVGNMTGEEVKKNRAYSKRRKFKYANWECYTKPRCAVVGGGKSAEKHFDRLRLWEGDVYAINDMAGILSDNDISCYMYSIDGSPIKYKTGKNVKGALFSSRCHKNQFRQFKHENIRVFDSFEDVEKDGIQGGPTGLTRAPHLFIKMGHAGVDFFGCEGSFFDQSHSDSDHKDARTSALIIRVAGIDYLTHAGFMLQCQYMVGLIRDFPKIYTVTCGGLLQAKIENPDTWSVVAVNSFIKKQHEKQGGFYKEPYKFERPVWGASK